MSDIAAAFADAGSAAVETPEISAPEVDTPTGDTGDDGGDSTTDGLEPVTGCLLYTSDAADE